MTKKIIRQKPKDRPRKHRIKSHLKMIVEEYNTYIFPLVVLILDLVDDGQINYSMLSSVIQ